MFAAITSVALVGIDPVPVRVEAHVGGSRPSFSIVGLPDPAVREAKERVRAAIAASGLRFPSRRITVNLAPADIPKAGSAYDLPIALGVLAAAGEAPPGVTSVVALGELALDGRVRAARGGLGAAIVARREGVRCVVPTSSASEGAMVTGADVRGVGSLAHAMAVALGEDPGIAPEPAGDLGGGPAIDLAEVRGQAAARRALEIAAAGGHHLLLVGPPGSGKTMLARCVPGILPALAPPDLLEVARAWSAAGRVPQRSGVPPFRSPHHSATVPAIIGGGSGLPVPGELTLAHRGVLFLDEIGEFPAHLLDTLRQPLEEGQVHIARKGASVTFPCDVQVVAATNPCPCGFQGDRTISCRCSPGAVDRYRRRLSGPLLDRFDLRVPVPRVDASELMGGAGESSTCVSERVAGARDRQARRGVMNRSMTRPMLDALVWSRAAGELLRAAVAGVDLSARGWDRVRRVAVTVADLAGSDTVEEAHVAEALAMRGRP